MPTCSVASDIGGTPTDTVVIDDGGRDTSSTTMARSGLPGARPTRDAALAREAATAGVPAALPALAGPGMGTTTAAA